MHEQGEVNRMFTGIFYSKLMYCLPVFGNVNGLAIYRDTRGRSAGMTMNECNKLQVQLQNSVNRLITGARHGVATADLLSDTNSLSIQQMVAYYTLIMVHKIPITRNPAYLAGRLKLRNEDERELQWWGGRTVEIPDYSLETSRAGFVFRGGRLYNSVRRDVNIQVQRRSKEVGERADTSETKTWCWPVVWVWLLLPRAVVADPRLHR